jgi:hypothetical protein
MMGKGGRWCCLGRCACKINTGFLVFRGPRAHEANDPNDPRADGPTTGSSAGPGAHSLSWAEGLLHEMLVSPRCQPYWHARQWDQDCLQALLYEAGELPGEDSLRRMLTGTGPGAGTGGGSGGGVVARAGSLMANGTTTTSPHEKVEADGVSSKDVRSPRAAMSPSGRVCILPHAAVAPPLPSPRAGGAGSVSGLLLSPDHGAQKQWSRYVANALRSSPRGTRGGTTGARTAASTAMPFALHATQVRGCSRAHEESCDKASLFAPLHRAEEALYYANGGEQRRAAVDACVRRLEEDG